MGTLWSKEPENFESALSYEFTVGDALTKWFGEPASYAHCFYLDDFATSFISEVVYWKVGVMTQGKKLGYAELILKSFPRPTTQSRSFRSDDFFKNEISFYDNILPALLEYQNTKEVKGTFNNHLRVCFSFREKGYDRISFGDARVEGYNRTKLPKFDLKHGKLMLRSLARFHALSFALKTENVDKFNALCSEISETYYSQRFWGWYRNLWAQICGVAVNAVEMEYPDSIYVEKIKEFAVPKRYKDFIKAVSDKGNGVIIHGDCGTSNCLFKYIEDEPVDVKMLDFQQARCASPALDVSSILYSSPELLKDYDALLSYYHGNLITGIKEFGGDPDVYTYDTFASEMSKYSFFGLAFCFESVCTKRTTSEITDKVCEWIGKRIHDQNKLINMADVYGVKNLENEERRDVAASFVHWVHNGYI